MNYSSDTTLIGRIIKNILGIILTALFYYYKMKEQHNAAYTFITSCAKMKGD